MSLKSAGGLTSPNANGARCARTIQTTKRLGSFFLMIMHVPELIGGAKTV